MFKELFDVYKASNEAVRESFPNSTTLPKFGDIVDIVSNNVFVTALCLNESEFILMSNFHEFATNTDLIVETKGHPISDKWIIELDKRLHIDKNNTTYTISSHLSDEDKNLIKKIISGSPVPPEKCGPKVPFNKKDYRWKFNLEELKKTLLINQSLFFEKE